MLKNILRKNEVDICQKVNNTKDETRKHYFYKTKRVNA